MQTSVTVFVALCVAGITAFPRPRPLKVDCESLGSVEEFRHRLKWRENAEDKSTIHLLRNEELHIVFSLDKTTAVDILNVQYSNDGLSDILSLKLDEKLLGTFKTTEHTDWGNYWNVFHASGPIGGRQTLEAGNHTLTLKVEDADHYGVEIDFIRVDVHGSIMGKKKKDRFMCIHKPSSSVEDPNSMFPKKV